jgi:hypothetical protein
MQYEPYTCIETKVRERKLNFFSRGITLSKNHPTMTLAISLQGHKKVMVRNVVAGKRLQTRRPLIVIGYITSGQFL